MAQGKKSKKGKKGRSKAGSRKHGRRPTKRALQAYYGNVRKAYKRLKPIAEEHGFA